jgi:transglutaminase-like putative cysteine protease
VLFEITHAASYFYSRPVFLEPHVIRLRPRCDAAQSLIDFEIKIEPKPSGLSDCSDLEGNVICQAWFEGLTGSVSVKTRSRVGSLRLNPFDYIVADPTAKKLPMTYPDLLKTSLMPYCLRPHAGVPVERFAGAVAAQAGWETLPFLIALSRRIHEMCEQVVREEGDPLPAEVSLSRKQGSCRDLAVLFMDCCRAVGIAARFISGYQEGEPDQKSRYLHAWAEVYLPGGGWRGYDPTYGLAVADRHIALAAAAIPSLATPIAGSFRGTGAAANMRTDIDIRLSDKME